MDIKRIIPGARYSHAVKTGGFLFTLGVVAFDAPGADVTTQTEDVLKHLDMLMTEAGTDKSRVVSATIYLTDLKDFDAMNAAWDKWVIPNHAPARTTIQAALVSKEHAVEIAIVAAAD